MIRESNISHHNLGNVQTLGDNQVQSVPLIVRGLCHMLSQSIALKNTTQFFGPSVLGVVNMNVKITSNNYTVKVNTDYKQQFIKIVKKVCTVFRWPVDI